MALTHKLPEDSISQHEAAYCIGLYSGLPKLNAQLICEAILLTPDDAIPKFFKFKEGTLKSTAEIVVTVLAAACLGESLVCRTWSPLHQCI
jgi:hypothetical protein